MMEPKKSAFFVLTLICVENLAVQGARILAVLPLFTGSHHIFSQPLLKTLARAGHQVVVYSPFPLDHPVPNYTDVFMDNVSIKDDKIDRMILNFISYNQYTCLDIFADTVDKVFTDFLQSKQVQKLVKSSEHFDLVITEALVGQEFTLILGHIFKAPVIALQSLITNNVVNSDLGNSLSLTHKPDTCASYSNKMSFLERFSNILSLLRNLYYLRYNTYLPLMEERLRKHFPDAPPLLDMINNISLGFVNDHLTVDYPQPRTPNIIPVAGIHIEEEKPLPLSIKTFMDEAPEGVILFSLGTYIPDELQSTEYFDMYCRVFRQLRQRVLWKTRKENIQGLPDNVMTIKWAPQRDVLAHPNCVLFITHGGLLSRHEAIHCGVPVVAIPQFYDQHGNARFYEEKGVGVRLNNWDLTEFNVISAIRTVLDDYKYTKNMKRLSRLFRDRPLTPAETVVFWTEHVLRHGGSHLRPASTQLSWYQRALLDLLAAILAVICFSTMVVYFISRIICDNIRSKFSNIVAIKKCQ